MKSIMLLFYDTPLLGIARYYRSDTTHLYRDANKIEFSRYITVIFIERSFLLFNEN